MGSSVMGAAWPALSESAKASLKGSPSSSDSPESVSDVPNSNNSAAPNHAPPTRQKSMRRGGGGGGSVGNNIGVASATGVQQPGGAAISPTSPASLVGSPHSTRDQQAAPQGKNSGNWDRGARGGGLGSQLHGNIDHHRGHGGNRRGNNGGGGFHHHNNYSNNRDQERGSYDGYHHRGYGGREAHMQQWGSRPYIRPPQTAQISSPFISPVPMVRPFGNPLAYPDVPSPVIYVAPQQPTEPFAGLPFIPYPPAPPAFFLPPIDPQRDFLMKQIEYYFSNENLCKDTYLRQHMDEQGWVLASVIAGFNRVKARTDSISFILDTVRSSTLVEVQGEKIRRRRDWMNWVLPPSNSPTVAVYGQQIVSTQDLVNLTDSLQAVGLGMSGIENTVRISAHGEVGYSRSASGNLGKQFQVVGDLNRDGNEQVIGHVNSDGSNAIKSLSRSGAL